MEVRRLRAFTRTLDGGNPAGVVLDARGLPDFRMQQVAADVGYSETAFVTGRPAPGVVEVRYFAPSIEVPFCGHATVATAVALADDPSLESLVFRTRSGEVPVGLTREDGVSAELTSVEPWVRAADPEPVGAALHALGWSTDELDPLLPPAVAFAGANHLVLGVAGRETLAEMDYDFAVMAELMRAQGWVTLQLFFRERDDLVHSRNPFAGAGVYEDPATGAAALALGAYLRELGQAPPGGELLVVQGEDMGSRSELRVRLVEGDPRVRVRGHAVEIPTEEGATP